jgi:putrescine importer
VPPALGFIICFYLWTQLSSLALAIGGAWLALGVVYGAWRTDFYRKPLRMFVGDESPAEETR